MNIITPPIKYTINFPAYPNRYRYRYRYRSIWRPDSDSDWDFSLLPICGAD